MLIYIPACSKKYLTERFCHSLFRCMCGLPTYIYIYKSMLYYIYCILDKGFSIVLKMNYLRHLLGTSKLQMCTIIFLVHGPLPILHFGL